jgi:hypothetical protein
MRKDIAFVVVSCDRYKDLWPGFFKTFFKYWKECSLDIFLISNFEPYHDERVQSILIGEDRDYASNLVAAIQKIEHQWIFLWLEDCMFSNTINDEKANDILKSAIQTSNLGYLKLSNDYPTAYACIPGLPFGVIPKRVKYRSAIGMSLYRKDVLLKLLEPGKNAWEVDKSDISDNLSEDFYALSHKLVNKPIFPYVNTVIKGKWYLSAVSFLKKEGLSSMLLLREKQSTKDFIYIKLFWAWFFFLRTFKIHWYNKP